MTNGVRAFIAGIAISDAVWDFEIAWDVVRRRRRRRGVVGLRDVRFSIIGRLSDAALVRFVRLDNVTAVNVTLRNPAARVAFTGPAWLDYDVTPDAAIRVDGVAAGAWRRR